MKQKVFVSGCYDMLHSGHIAFFQEAAKLGDLYVGLGSDETIWELKGRKTINNNAERLFMVKAIRYVTDAWINSGSGIMDFEKEVLELKPDIFFVNSDGFTPAKEEFCKKNNIKLIVSQRIPSAGLPARSTTASRAECRIPYRVELCGGWMDQPLLNNIAPGAVLTCSIEPEYEFNERSGMATSSRKNAIKLWQTQLPVGDIEENAKTLFCVENPPGTTRISGSQDQLGIFLPGLNRLNYNQNFWPVSIDSIHDDDILHFVENHLYLVQLEVRKKGYDVYKDVNITEENVKRLAASADAAWEAIQNKDAAAWGKATTDCFNAQLAMFPNMAVPEIEMALRNIKDLFLGYKLTGAGGGGYLIVISEKPVTNAVKIKIRRRD